MNTAEDTDTAQSLGAHERDMLQAVGLVTCSLSFLGSLYVLVHSIWERYGGCSAAQRRQLLPPSRALDFNAQLVIVLSFLDLMTAIARMVGRAFVENETLCDVQAAILHATGIAIFLWTTCISFNLYRWIVFGESEKKRRSRLGVYVLGSFAPALVVIMYPLREHKYGDATFFCWLAEPGLMFLHFYSYYILLASVNIALLAFIRISLSRRVDMHNFTDANATYTVIRRKTLLYIIVFVLHRTPMLVYRLLESFGVESFPLAVFVFAVVNLDGLANAVVYGGLCRRAPVGNRRAGSGGGDLPRIHMTPCNSDVSMDSDECLTKRIRTGVMAMVPEEHFRATESRTSISVEATPPSSQILAATLLASPSITNTPVMERDSFHCAPYSRNQLRTPTTTANKKPRGIAACLLERGSSHELGSDHERGSMRRSIGHRRKPASTPPTPSPRSKSLGIFVSTFNMGEQNVCPSELTEWIPIGHEVYVIGVQECMNVGDLQTKVQDYLYSTTQQEYRYYSREIGKRATALGYHGYIALIVFVLEEAVQQGRFEMPHREAMSKHAHEVYRGKSLLVFGRASNKGAVGMSFRYGNTSFAFVTCHLASDSSSKVSSKLSFRGKQADGSASDNISGRRGSCEDADTPRRVDGSEKNQQGLRPLSKVERRNQDAIEILQQLSMDEEDYGFGFQLLHHHSFVLGDLNYRMNCKGSTPMEMLNLLNQVGDAHVNAHRKSRDRSFSRMRPSSSGPPPDICDMYEEFTTPSKMSLMPSIPGALGKLIQEHDELSRLRETSKVFYGFDEPPIKFFPTFRRIREQALSTCDIESLSQNYSLLASGSGGYRVPSYTDRILHSSLPGRKHQVQCLYYDSCEAVTTSDHKPVCAVFRVAGVVNDRPAIESVLPRPFSLFSGGSLRHHRKNVGDPSSTCEIRLKMEFRSIQWMDSIDHGTASLFSQLENVDFGFLFPLPCEDAFSRQRKLQEIADNLTWKQDTRQAPSLPPSSSAALGTIPPSTSNFHLVSWNQFVEAGVHYHTRACTSGKKHVAVLIRTRARNRQRTTSSRSRTRSTTSQTSANGSTSAPFSSSGRSVLPRRGNQRTTNTDHAIGPTSSSAMSFSSSTSVELTLGHGVFCIDDIGRRHDTCVPLTLGGSLVGSLQLRVSLQTPHGQSGAT